MTTTARKEFWQMTRREVGAADLPDSVVQSVLQSHWQAVKQAIEQGKPVPNEVLADYPEFGKPLDKPVQSDIMTSEGKENDSTDIQTSIRTAEPRPTESHGTQVREREQTERAPKNEGSGRTGRISQPESLYDIMQSDGNKVSFDYLSVL